MVGMKPPVFMPRQLSSVVDSCIWNICRFVRSVKRRRGLFPFLLAGCVLLAAGAIFSEREQANIATISLKERINIEARHTMSTEPRRPDIHARMRAFEKYLLPHEQIPDAIRELFKLAEAENLEISRGEYRPQTDIQGNFLRYRMAMPVKGDAQTVYRFMRAALHSQNTLALESVQFKRERIQSSELDARIQWVMFTKLPGKISSESGKFE